jgi:hypothetical protein
MARSGRQWQATGRGGAPSLPQSPESEKAFDSSSLQRPAIASGPLGSDWGRSRRPHLTAIGLALALATCGLAAVSPADASPVPGKEQGSPAVLGIQPANLAGSLWMGVAAVEVDGELWAELRMSAGATKGSTANGFSADGAVVDHKRFRLSVSEAADLARELRAWVAAPHSVTLYSYSTGPIGAAVTGNAWNPELQPVVVVQITCWIPVDRGQVHGGQYMALGPRWANALANALESWSEKPAATAGLLFQRYVQ